MNLQQITPSLRKHTYYGTEKTGISVFFSLLMILIVFSTNGCKLEDQMWIDKMLEEVGNAFLESDKAGIGQDGRDAAMAKAVHKYFPIGMRKEDAFVLLQEMKNSGFDIAEYRHEGFREWPSGTSKPYMDEETKRNLQRQYPPGTYEIIAIRKWRTRLVVEEFFAVSVTISNDSGLVERVSVNRSSGFL